MLGKLLAIRTVLHAHELGTKTYVMAIGPRQTEYSENFANPTELDLVLRVACIDFESLLSHKIREVKSSPI